MTIAISKAQADDPKYARYAAWLSEIDPTLEIVDLSALNDPDALVSLEKANGIVFTGGPDIHPSRYGKPEAVNQCGPFDEERDRREFEWLAVALKREIPILGICRGMQLMNVAFGGTLIPDIPSVTSSSVIHKDPTKDVWHEVRVEPGASLPSDKGVVNSCHHQAVDKVGSGLRITARSADGIAEACEGKNILCVQWHPERMPIESPLSKNIAEAFLETMKKNA